MAGTQTLEVELELPRDGDCGACVARVGDALQAHDGIDAVQAGEDGRALLVRYDPELCSLACMREAAADAAVQFEREFDHEVLEVGGMDCAGCARTIERAVGRIAGVTFASVSFTAERLRVEYRPSVVDPPQIARGVRALGYVVPTGGEAPPDTGRWPRTQIVTAVATSLLLLAIVADLVIGSEIAARILYGSAAALGGVPIARSGLAALRATRQADIKLLMTLAVLGALAIGAWMEAALVVVLFSIGELLERRAAERARRELGGLVALTPATARVRRAAAGGGFEDVDVAASELVVGDLVVVRPGERLPADGSVFEGGSAVDEAAVTGESTPVDKLPGDRVFAGTLNAQGLLVVRVEAAPGDTTVAKIARLVAEAQARKAPSERWVDAFARVYTPLVIAGAVLVAGLAPAVLGISFADAFYAALALLIIACPCALVLSTPVSIVSALGRASASGVLIKGGAHLERAAGIRTVAFDKTGTLTLGRPRVVATEPFAVSEDELLAMAAGVEQGSEHPLARAIVDASGARGLALPALTDFEALTGLGARGRVDGRLVTVGGARMLGTAGELPAQAGSALERLAAGGRTAVLVTRDGEPIGALALADEPRPQAAEAVALLGRLGIERTVLLTGDNRAVAEAIAARLGVGELRAGLLPDEKASALELLGAGTAMVGDGVNDAPALAAADLGIAMGSAGSDTAIEVADVALMGDDPRKVAELVGLARWTRAVVRQNIAFSLATKLAALVLLAAGSLPLWAAVGADVGASLVVVANGLRLIVGTPGGRLRGIPILRPSAAGDAPGDRHDHADHDHDGDGQAHAGHACCDHEH
ncbi:MAG: cation-translocating P-type ATPase [Solirubrobacteraceae bacterium]|nr:cation-translocating P-type ATPase [Solirubrobacteraceae bacterium]